MKCIMLREAFYGSIHPETYEGGLFSAMENLEGIRPPWKGIIDPLYLDMNYFLIHSGRKTANEFIKHFYKGEKISLNDLNTIATSLLIIYNEKWHRIWHVEHLEYNPISNYDMLEESTDAEGIEYGKTISTSGTHTNINTTTNTRTPNLVYSTTENETRTPNIITEVVASTSRTPNINIVTQPAISDTTTSSIWAFNSSNSVDTGKTISSQTGNTTERRTGTEDENSITINNERGTDQKTRILSENETGTDITENNENIQGNDYNTEMQSGRDNTLHTHTLNRSGNIGVTTTQQMIESEITLRRHNFFNDIVFPDIDKAISLYIY